ncbi:Uncharacterised protein [Acidipropionibacterium jensenii]|uniref:Carbohydrate-binding module family 96 domain-containing protein n=1 Tax=Acidipropionibacterium jensenii TaxID=1749 RepID=A0A448P1N5_9ACTN|nr:DNRLRE domain-containing protein [Acidipropionibacterium jensenii]VEI04100.1 Uncharacterised protein [Acidipropionibacterium jensenii]
MTTTTLRAAYTTWLQQDHPTRNWFGKTGYMSLYGVSGRANMGLVWFGNPFPSAGANVVKATLTLRTRAVAGHGASQITAQLCAPWSNHFGTVTWNTRPAGKLAQASLHKPNPLATNQTWVFDVTAQMQAVASGEAFSGFVLTTKSEHQILVQGNMSHALDPSLSVEWQENPLPPTDLAPSTGQAVGTGSPVLRWSYRDYVGGDVLESAQVRTGTSETTVHTAPSWDSGEVATTVSQLDLSAQSGWKPPAKDTVVWWQVRCRDSSGVWSGWSDAVSWKWHPRPTVTLTQPDPAGSSFADPTPPIEWTYSGDMPQSRWAVSVDRLVGSRWVRVARSGVVAGADSRWTPTVGLAKAGTVRINVEVWDSRAREATPGMPISASVSQEFSFAPTKTVVAVSGLKVTPDPVLPSVALSWLRSEVPDRVDVYRDGKFLSSHPGLDWFRSGSSSSMRDAACPGGPHTWTVYAIVNGKSSKPATVTAKIKHRGTWIVDEDTGDRVCIVNDTDHDMTMPETVTEFAPIGGRSKIRVTSAQYGFEGSLSGVLAPQIVMPSTETPKLWHDRLLAWKSVPGKELRLLIEDLGFTINLTDVSVTSVPGRAGELFNVSLKFHQVDDFIFGENS